MHACMQGWFQHLAQVRDDTDAWSVNEGHLWFPVIRILMQQDADH
jgi:hypothetical protein